jgi:hypothetical protein
MLLAPGLDSALLGLTAVNSAYLLLFWAFVVGLRVSDNHAFGLMAVARLVLSGACFFACATLVAFGERSKLGPFLGTVAVLFNLDVIILGRSLFVVRTRCVQVLHILVICLILLVVGIWSSVFAQDLIDIIRASCPASNNKAMPVRVDGTHWACVKWGETVPLSHVPDPSEGIFTATCETSLDALPGIPSGDDVRAHRVLCPAGCASSSAAIIGCTFYDSASAVCRSALQAGALDDSTGGEVKVVRRPPFALAEYVPCALGGILSSSATVVSGRAFYFQTGIGAPQQRQDYLTLHSWEETGAVQNGHWQPWKNFAANVTWVLGGGEVQNQNFVLGPKANASFAVEVNFCNNETTCESE